MKVPKVEECTMLPSTMRLEPYVLLPDGKMYFTQVPKGRKFALMTKSCSNTYWIRIDTYETIEEAIEGYNRNNGNYYKCIAEVHPPSSQPTSKKWLAAIPTIQGYIYLEGKLTFNLSDYVNARIGFHPEGIEITQALANAFVNSKKYKKTYFQDAVFIKVTNEDSFGYGFTYFYGKYYFLGLCTKSNLEDFTFMPVKNNTPEWRKVNFLEAVHAANWNKKIKRISRSTTMDEVTKVFTPGEYKWDGEIISFFEIDISDWFILESDAHILESMPKEK